MADGEKVILQWSFQNWITVVFMVAIMFGAIGLIRAAIVTNIPRPGA